MDLTKIKDPAKVDAKDLKALLGKGDSIGDVMLEVLARLMRLEARFDVNLVELEAAAGELKPVKKAKKAKKPKK